MGYINSIQQVSITLGSAQSSNTATISAVGANAFIVWQGFTTDEAANNLYLDEFATLVLTNSTTVTATRTTSTTGTGTFNCVVIDPTSSLVTGVQAGTIAIVSGTSNTATITSVDTSLSAVFFLGSSTLSSTVPTSAAGVTLTNATTVTASISSTGTTTVSYVVVTFASAAIQSIQQLVKSGTGAATETSVISSVTTGNVLIANGGMKTNSDTFTRQYHFALTDATTISYTRTSGISGTSPVFYCSVIEFKTGVLKSLQRGLIVLSSVSSNTATVTAVTTANSFCNYLNFKSGAATSAPDTAYHKISLTNSTTVTATRNTAGATDSTISYEVVEFDLPTQCGFNPYYSQISASSGSGYNV